MQTFSRMRRNSTDTFTLSTAVFYAFLGAYLVLTSLYHFMPLLVGVFFVFVIIHADDEEKKFSVIMAFVYLCLFDLLYGSYLFSYVLTYLLFYNLFVEKIENTITCKNCILFVYVLAAYLGYFLVNSFLSYLFNTEIPYFEAMDFFYYIFLDFILALVVFRGRL